MKTIAQQLNVKEFPFIIKDKEGRSIYFEDDSQYWSKIEYKNGNEIIVEYSNGCWVKREWKDGNIIYSENSDGKIIDNRPKERPCVGKMVTIDGVEYELK